jgi:hypothetical protein
MPICHTIAIEAQGSEGKASLLVVGIDGRVWLTPANDQGFKPFWQTQLPMGKYRALPALSGNKLLVRTSLSPDAQWMCFDL